MPSLQRHAYAARSFVLGRQPLPWVVLALWLSLLSLFSLPAHAKRVALVVGNAAYADKPLRNPVNDAALMQRTLQGLGFEVSLLRNADRRTLLAGLRDFEAKARDADVALFYFAGHGTQVGGNNYLLPLQAQIRAENDVPDEAVDANTVLRRIEDAKAKVGLVILDACRDNPYAGATRSSSRGLGRMSVPTGSIVAYATAPGSTAEDGSGQNGVYTEQLAKHLCTPGLDLREVFDRTATEVERLTGGKQKPREDVGLRGRFVLKEGLGTPVASAVPVPADPEQEAWDIAKRRDTVAAYQVYLNRYPNGRYAQTAQDALAGLQPAVAPMPQPTSQPATATSTPLGGCYHILANGAEVKDLQTGLVWQRCSVGQQWDGQTCTGKASEFTFNQAQQLSRNGWRVPSKDELVSLVDKSAGSPTIHAQAFPGTPTYWFWTSTTYTGNASSEWGVSFKDGFVYYPSRNDYFHVRLVR